MPIDASVCVNHTEVVVNEIINYLNEWRSKMEFIDVEFTDEELGTVCNLPPLEGDDLLNIRSSIEGFLLNGWNKKLIIRFLRCLQEVCPFWKEEYALRWMYEVDALAMQQGATNSIFRK